MSVFVLDVGTGMWTPSVLARGPFAGLQGGAVTALMTSQIEAQADAEGWGSAVSVTAWFFRPTPLLSLRVAVNPCAWASVSA